MKYRMKYNGIERESKIQWIQTLERENQRNKRRVNCQRNKNFLELTRDRIESIF